MCYYIETVEFTPEISAYSVIEWYVMFSSHGTCIQVLIGK